VEPKQLDPDFLGYDGFQADLFAAGLILLKMIAGKDLQEADFKGR
jgi:hypothetical protein